MTAPIDIATNHTTEFIQRFASGSGEALEVGCGMGHLARALIDNGLDVIAIDADGDAVTAARSKGVNAYEANWPDFETGKLDAVIFTRSLHHIHDLDGAVSAAYKRLRNRGILLVEDFAFDQTDSKTIDWFVSILSQVFGENDLNPPKDSFLADLQSSKNKEHAWAHSHHHDLHTISAMESAVADAFGQYEPQDAPYLYRYLITGLEGTTIAADKLRRFLKLEEAAITNGDISAIGRRIIAIKK